ncbi:LysR family transcriptional regulator [Sphingomonas morindae]|uniref:LysR family transcriptional regulator n=1 Tax=Sphingomonas morindae TaxID=1541170 RepID=A0ABY4XAC7_9SPHN|nr:LysR family transcriptional regulator [Sphingomonas morindae]USI73884.1 LysR family transcriptional regulator [Sphingomonas morindae]
MEWSDIKVFLQVVRDRTMTEATNALRMDHSTISRRIARLEKEAGVPLFERAGRRLAVTEEGQRLTEAAEKLESIILREVMTLAEARSNIAGRVRIGATEEFGAHYLAARLPEIAREHPDLDLDLVAISRNFSLASREVDVVVTMDRPSSGDLRFRKLTSFEFGVYGTAGYFASRRPPNLPVDLLDESWCGFITEMLQTTELDVCAGQELRVEPRYRTTTVTAQLATVRSGAALAFLPCFVGDAHEDLERVLPDELRPTRDYWLAVHEDLADSPRVRAVMDGIADRVTRDRRVFDGVPADGARGSSSLAPEALPSVITRLATPVNAQA